MALSPLRLKTRIMKHKKALTLVEVLLSLAFISIVFFPVLQMFSQGSIISSESEGAVRATALAEGAMEEEVGKNYSALISSPKAAIPGKDGFSKEVVVTQTSTNLKDIEVRISYPVGNSELTVVLKTLVANF